MARHTVKLTAFGLIIVGLLTGVGFYVWEQLPIRTQQTEYAGFIVGMSRDEVIYKKGYPDWVISEGRLIRAKGRRVEDYAVWLYDEDHARIHVRFDALKNTVITLACFANCPAIAGIGTGVSEQDVIRRFGQPAFSEISDGTKELKYPKVGVIFALTKERVGAIIIRDMRYTPERLQTAGQKEDLLVPSPFKSEDR